ncbi:DUF5719 family protein [Nocardiopsis algeriensis]|uniref:Secreted protein n=1 Tax=Nocardiopsis algeriensis TaxID=1478215 RepID=A0A841IR34_9ACTN|nr:hypothetical protein [Nocardiopsis algeriensis]
MRLIAENRFALLGLVATALAALFGIALATGPVTAELGVTGPETVRPELALRVCPAPHAASDARSSVAAFAPRVSRDDGGGLWAVPVPRAPEEDGGEDEGSATAGGRLGEVLTEPGSVWKLDTGEERQPVAVHAEQALAPGLDATQITLADGAATEVRCVEPSVSTWFALPGVGDSEGVRLESVTAHLANPERSHATVSVDVYTSGGPSRSAESRGISLGPGESTELDLTEPAGSIGGIGVQVRTSSGRVAVSVLAEHVSGSADWVPPTAAPATEHVVAGVPGGAGRRHLVVSAPGQEPARVRVHVLSSAEDGGGGTPGRSADDPLVLDVPPAASAWLTLESALGGEPGTVLLEADVPVIAGVAVEAADGERKVVETAYTSVVPPLSFPLDTMAVLPDVPVDADTELVLGAPRDDVSLMATPIGPDGTQGDAVRTVVEAGTTTVFGGEEAWSTPDGVDPEDGHALRLEVLEGSGPLHAARVLRSGEGLSVLPVRPAPVEIALPDVRHTMVGVVP